LKKKKISYLNSAFGLNPRLGAACMAQPVGAMAQRFMGVHQRGEAESDPLSKSDPIALDPTQ
jgi:hypothetical protein